MRVLIVSAWDPVSGVLTVYRLLAQRLAPRGVSYSAYAFDGWGDDTLWTFCDELIDGRCVTLSEVLMSGRYDLLHCMDSVYSPPYGVETWVRRARFRGPIVLMSQLARRELTGPARATRYVACSADAAEVLALDADGDVIVIPSGYDQDVFRPGPAPPAPRPLLVWAGRSADPQKDLGLFLDGVESLPDHDAVILDASFESSAARSVAARVGSLGGRVRHLGFQSPETVADLLRQAGSSGGALVSTSRYEGFPVTVLDAMACACPVVAPAVPGMSHLVDGTNAVIFERAGGSTALVEAVGRSADPGLRSRIVERGLADVQQWSSRASAEAFLRVYEDALAATSPPTPLQRLLDPIARAVWRFALRARPRVQRLRRTLRRSGTGMP